MLLQTLFKYSQHLWEIKNTASSSPTSSLHLSRLRLISWSAPDHWVDKLQRLLLFSIPVPYPSHCMTERSSHVFKKWFSLLHLQSVFETSLSLHPGSRLKVFQVILDFFSPSLPTSNQNLLGWIFFYNQGHYSLPLLSCQTTWNFFNWPPSFQFYPYMAPHIHSVIPSPESFG